jgi:type II secretion system protein G
LRPGSRRPHAFGGATAEVGPVALARGLLSRVPPSPAAFTAGAGIREFPASRAQRKEVSMLRKNTKGFTLIELLIVVAIIGIIAAIAIPNLLNAIQRGKQKRTMGDLRTVATANEQYSIDNNQYVAAASGDVIGITTHLEPTYVKKMPNKDGWGTDFQYESDSTEYTLRSYGKNLAAGGGGSVAANGGTTSFSNDIIFSTGSFVQFPDGTQR